MKIGITERGDVSAVLISVYTATGMTNGGLTLKPFNSIINIM